MTALTEIYDLPIRYGGAGPVRVLTGALTGSTDITVWTPAATNCVFLVGQFFAETSAVTLTYKSNATTIVIPEWAANQGIINAIGNGVVLATKAGDPLIVNASATVTSAVFHIIEAAALVFA